MKIDKIIDAIGLINDEYIEEAHTNNTKKSFSISFNNILKLSTAALCFVLLVTQLPKIFKSSSSDYYTSQDNGYVYEAYDSYNAETIDMKEDRESFEYPLTTNKKLIVSANLNLETQDLDKIVESLKTNVNNFEAYIQRSSTYTRGNGSRIYDATIRIPADKYESFISEIENSGNKISYYEEIEDITNSYMDIDARLNSLKTQEERVLEFYNSANTIEDLMSIEERLADLRYQIEYYESIIKNYDLLVSYSTLNITITETKIYTQTNSNFFTRIINAFVNGWNNFINGISDFVIDVVYNFWTILFIVLLIIIVYKIYKHIKKIKRN